MWARVCVRTGWATLAVAVLVFSIIGALVMPVGLMITLSLLGLAIGAALGKGVLPKEILARPSVQRLVVRGESNVWTGIVAASGFVLACLAVTGLFAVAGAAATAELMGCGAAAGTFFALRFWHAPSTPRQSVVIDIPAPAPITRPAPVIQVAALPLDELCLAWRRSYLQLQRAADEPTRQQLIRARQAYLDELERRDGPGFTRWLDSGARPGGNPRRYLTAS